MQFQSLLILQDFHDDEWKYVQFLLFNTMHNIKRIMKIFTSVNLI